MKIDGYIRVSRRNGREGESFRSPQQQREIIERWAASNGAELVAWHEDIDQSGSRMDRPALNGALDRIRAGATLGVAVAFLDRFSRAKVSEAMAVHEEVTALGGRVVAADLPSLDPSDKMGELTLTQMLAWKRMEWRTTAERWDMSRGDAIKCGKAIGGAPFGYSYRDATPRERGRGVVDSRLVVHEAEAQVVRDLFERKAHGATWLELARWLDKVAPKASDAHWARSTVADMVRRRTYLGEVSHGKHVKTDAHEPILSAALWRRAQREPGHRTPRGTYLLSGLVRCAGCGRNVRGTSLGRGLQRTYSCSTEGCKERATVMVHLLEGEVVEQFFAHLDAFHVRGVDGAGIAAAEREVERLTGEVERLASVVPSHPAAIAAHQSRLHELEGELSEAEDRRDHLASSALQGGANVHELRADWPTMTLDEKRDILRAGVRFVLLRRAASRARPPVRERILVGFYGDDTPEGLVDGVRGAPLRRWTWDDSPGSLALAAS